MGGGWAAILGKKFLKQRWEFHITHDASRLISVFPPRRKERSKVSREIFNKLNFKMELTQGKYNVLC